MAHSAADGSQSVGYADIAIAIRQALYFTAPPTVPVRLDVPIGRPWPEESEWQRFSIRTHHTGDATRTGVSIKAWSPSWAGSKDPSIHGMRPEERRIDAEVPGDPEISEISGFTTYTSHGQRNAIRAAIALPPGGTLAVPLPTASGKSTIALAPTLLAGQGLALIIVPTVALALDFESRIRSRFESLGLQRLTRLAYHSGLTDSEREAVRGAIRTGVQRFVVTSPESALHSLRFSLEVAAERGDLEYFVVDEAHIVAQWGDGFRPDFQHLHGLRSRLLDVQSTSGNAPFRTLLLSATFNQYALDIATEQFGKPGPVWTVGELAIRAEHDYWASVLDWAEKDVAVFESIDHTPRPTIVYTTTRRDAEVLGRRLKGRGYERFAVFTGDTNNRSREDIIDRWRRGDLDIVVATSAFGLGVDVAGVRCVIHAALPENPDRHYQEVGRSGRDGMSAVSITLHTDRDRRTAESLGRKTVITTELARERWNAMFLHRQPSQLPDALRIDPNRLPPRLNTESDWSRQWNYRTIQMTYRAGFIEILSEPPPTSSVESDEEQDRMEEKWDEWNEWITIRLRRDDLASDEPWLEGFERARSDIHLSRGTTPGTLSKVLTGSQCVASALVEEYQLTDLHADQFTAFESCGGCHWCRENHLHPYAMDGNLYTSVDPHTIPSEVGQGLESLLQTNRLIVVFEPSEVDKARKSFARLPMHGIRHLFAPLSEVEPIRRSLRRRSRHQPVFFLDDVVEWTQSPPPILWFPGGVFLAGSTANAGLRDVWQAGELLRVIMAPVDSAHPTRPDRLLKELEPTLPLSAFAQL